MVFVLTAERPMGVRRPETWTATGGAAAWLQLVRPIIGPL